MKKDEEETHVSPSAERPAKRARGDLGGGRKNSVLQIAFVKIPTREFEFVFDVYTAVTRCYITHWIGLLGLCAQRPVGSLIRSRQHRGTCTPDG